MGNRSLSTSTVEHGYTLLDLAIKRNWAWRQTNENTSPLCRPKERPGVVWLAFGGVVKDSCSRGGNGIKICTIEREKKTQLLLLRLLNRGNLVNLAAYL